MALKPFKVFHPTDPTKMLGVVTAETAALALQVTKQGRKFPSACMVQERSSGSLGDASGNSGQFSRSNTK